MLIKDLSFQLIVNLFKVSKNSNNSFKKVNWQTHILFLSVV